MATRRKSTKGKAGAGEKGRRKAPPPGRARTNRRRGARQAKAPEAARELRAPDSRVLEAAAGVHSQTAPTLRLAEPPAVEEPTGRSEERDRQAADREAAQLARQIEAAVGSAGDTLRTGPANAPDQLRIHREQMEEAARRREEARDLPGAAAIGLELALGALRLVRAVATAPVRLGLALLRGGDGSA